MVFASRPEASWSRRAARPVGAASVGFKPTSASATSSERSSVVLPVPGPPVITVTRTQGASQRALLLGRQREPRRFAAAATARLITSPDHRSAGLQFRDSGGDVHLGLVQAREVNRG